MMRRQFRDAHITDYETLIPSMTNDPKDRHVLATAVRGGAALIVTANTKDFPPEATEPYDITVASPDEFLLNQLELHSNSVLILRLTVVTTLIDIIRHLPIGTSLEQISTESFSTDIHTGCVTAASHVVRPGRPDYRDRTPPGAPRRTRTRRMGMMSV